MTNSLHFLKCWTWLLVLRSWAYVFIQALSIVEHMVTHSTTFSPKRMGPVRAEGGSAQYCFLSFISRCFFMLWPSGFCSGGNIFYKHFYISVLYLSKPWHWSAQTFIVSIFVLLWNWNLKLNVCSMLFLMRRRNDERKSSLFPSSWSMELNRHS